MNHELCKLGCHLIREKGEVGRRAQHHFSYGWRSTEQKPREGMQQPHASRPTLLNDIEALWRKLVFLWSPLDRGANVETQTLVK